MLTGLKKCCCYDLKSGCLIIAVSELLMGVLGVVVFSVPRFNLSFLVLSLITLIEAVFLNIGLKLEKPKYFSIWIQIKIVATALLGILILKGIYSITTLDKSVEDIKPALIIEVLLIVAFAVSILFLMIVKSYKRQSSLPDTTV